MKGKKAKANTDLVATFAKLGEAVAAMVHESGVNKKAKRKARKGKRKLRAAKPRAQRKPRTPRETAPTSHEQQTAPGG